MVQFLSIIFFSWISSIFVGFFKSSIFLCHPVFCCFSHSGCMANHRNVPIVCPLRLVVQDHVGPLTFGVSINI